MLPASYYFFVNHLVMDDCLALAGAAAAVDLGCWLVEEDEGWLLCLAACEAGAEGALPVHHIPPDEAHPQLMPTHMHHHSHATYRHPSC